MKKTYPNSLRFRKKIMRHYAFLSLLLFINVFTPIDKCPCADTQGTNHTRFDVKTRLPEAADGDKITFSKLNKLKITNQQIQKLKTDGTQILPTEQNPVHFTGYLCLLKISRDDCDMHFEISFKRITKDEFEVGLRRSTFLVPCSTFKNASAEQRSLYDRGKPLQFAFIIFFIYLDFHCLAPHTPLKKNLGYYYPLSFVCRLLTLSINTNETGTFTAIHTPASPSFDFYIGIDHHRDFRFHVLYRSKKSGSSSRSRSPAVTIGAIKYNVGGKCSQCYIIYLFDCQQTRSQKIPAIWWKRFSCRSIKIIRRAPDGFLICAG